MSKSFEPCCVCCSESACTELELCALRHQLGIRSSLQGENDPAEVMAQGSTPALSQETIQHKQLLSHLAKRKMWTFNSARALLLRLEDALAPHYHVALGGSVLLAGASDKDLDVFVYPHNAQRLPIHKSGRVKETAQALRAAGLNLVAGTELVRAWWRKAGSEDTKVVEVWKTEDERRVDIFHVD